MPRILVEIPLYTQQSDWKHNYFITTAFNIESLRVMLHELGVPSFTLTDLDSVQKITQKKLEKWVLENRCECSACKADPVPIKEIRCKQV